MKEDNQTTRPSLTRFILIIVGILVCLVSGCSKLEQKYIRKDKLARIANIDDSRDDQSIMLKYMIDADPEVRTQAALAIARIGGNYYKGGMWGIIGDTLERPARAKLFAAGKVCDIYFFDEIYGLLDENPPARDAIVEALGYISDSTKADTLSLFLSDPDSIVVYQALFALWRTKSWAYAERMADLGLTTDNRKILYGALYTLSRAGRPEGRKLFLEEVGDADAEYRMLAYRGLGRMNDTVSAPVVATGLNDTDRRVAAEAIRTLTSYGVSGGKYIFEKLRSLEDENLRVMAIDALREIGYRRALPTMRSLFTSDTRENVRAAIARALVVMEGATALLEVDSILTAPTTYQRQQLAVALGSINKDAALARLATLRLDPRPIVRATALESLCKVDSANAHTFINAALHDSDFVVVTTAVDLIKTYSLDDLLPVIATKFLNYSLTLHDDVKREIVAVCGHFAPSPDYDSAIVQVLSEAVNDEWRVLRKEAAETLFDKYNIDLRQKIYHERSKIEARNYSDFYEKYDRDPRAVITTTRGEIVVELLYHDAPRTVTNFIKLAKDGFYDNLIFHRVVPNFVIQDGCPRGDGWGGPGYTIRSEFNMDRYTTGSVGMAHSGEDTGGSQYFITLSPQPHLNGNYTLFGRVRQGMDIAQNIVRGDSILTVEIKTKE